MRARSLVLFALGLAVAGCSESGAPNAPRATAPTARADAPAGSPVDASAEAEVRSVSERFMRAVVRGDSAEASRWVTPLAAQRAANDPGVLGTIGYAAESLVIGEVRLVSPDEAAAQCLLTESGVTEPQEIGCLLKRSPAGWRLCGMACEAGPGEPPILVNFEGDSPAAPTPINLVDDSARYTPPQTAARPAETERR